MSLLLVLLALCAAAVVSLVDCCLLLFFVGCLLWVAGLLDWWLLLFVTAGCLVVALLVGAAILRFRPLLGRFGRHAWLLFGELVPTPGLLCLLSVFLKSEKEHRKIKEY